MRLCSGVFAVLLGLAASVACGGQTTLGGADGGDGDGGGDDARAADDARAPGADASLVIATSDASDADDASIDSGLPDGRGPGLGCVYVSGYYGTGAGSCADITIACPMPIGPIDACSDACPAVNVNGMPVSADRCNTLAGDAGVVDGAAVFLVDCRSPSCQG